MMDMILTESTPAARPWCAVLLLASLISRKHAQQTTGADRQQKEKHRASIVVSDYKVVRAKFIHCANNVFDRSRNP